VSACDERARELDALERPEGEPTWKPLAQIAELEYSSISRACFRPRRPRRDAVASAADEQVLEHRHVLEEHDVLEGARDSESHDPVGRRSRQVLPSKRMRPLFGR